MTVVETEAVPRRPIKKQLRKNPTIQFDYIGNAIGGGVDPSDIDSHYERNGHHLFIENKQPGEKFGGGQEIALKELRNLCPERVRVLVVYGYQGYPDDDIITGYRWIEMATKVDADIWEVRDLINKWWAWASKQKRPKR